MKPTCMQKKVILEVRLLREAAEAYVAFKRPRAAVHVHVRFEITWRRK